MSGVTLPQVVIAIVAVLGLGLSIYNFIVNVREKRPKLVVTPGFAPAIASHERAMHTITITNYGKVNVFVSQMYIEIGESRTFFPRLEGYRPLQSRLEPGEGLTLFQDVDPLHTVLRNRGFVGPQTFPLIVEDALGNRYRCDFEVDLGARPRTPG